MPHALGVDRVGDSLLGVVGGGCCLGCCRAGKLEEAQEVSISLGHLEQGERDVDSVEYLLGEGQSRDVPLGPLHGATVVMFRHVWNVEVASGDTPEVERVGLLHRIDDDVARCHLEGEAFQNARPHGEGSLLGIRVALLEQGGDLGGIWVDLLQVTDAVPPDGDEAFLEQLITQCVVADYPDSAHERNLRDG